MNTTAPVRLPANPRSMFRLRSALASVVTVLLVASGLSLGVSAAQAAPGDVTAATLNWGVKESFRDYVTGPISGGTWTVGGGVSDATPFSWAGGTGTATADTGEVGYGGSIRFTGHNGSLDLTLSNVRVERTGASTAVLIVDSVSNSFADAATFTTRNDVVFADVNLAGTNTSSGGTVSFAAAAATLTAAGAEAFSGFYTVGAALDPVSFSWPVEQAAAPIPTATPTPTPTATTPTVTVSKSANIGPAGEIVTVTGTGFSPNPPSTNGTRPPLAGKFAGVYVTFGKFAEVWQPSRGAASSARSVDQSTTKWFVNPADVATIGGAARGGVAINADGTFSVELLVKPGFAGEAATGNYGIYTYPGSGAVHAPFETYTPVTFSTAPTITVSKTSELNPLGDTVTVRGWNFAANAPATNGTRPPLAGKFGGAYVAFGKYPDVWKPSAAVPSSQRVNGSTYFVVSPDDVATVGGTARGAVAINADGSFSIEVPVKRNFAGEPTTGNYGIYTYPGSGSTYSAFESFTPVAFTAATPTTLALTSAPSSGIVEGGSATLTATVAPVAEGTITFRTAGTVVGSGAVDAAGRASVTVGPLSAGEQTFTAEFTPTQPLLTAGSTASITLPVAAPTVAAGSLSWGIKSAFRLYVTSTIAKGSITTAGVGNSGSSFVFGQASGGTFSATTGTGTSNYSGSVRFLGHEGLLDVRISDPVVRVDSASAATLFVSVNGGPSTAFANLNLAGGIRTTDGNTVGYRGVPATLTSAGASVFSYNGTAFYSAGEPLDAVSFVIGAPTGPLGGTATAAAFVAPREPAPTPPATEGVTVDPASLEKLVAGGEITISASGFQPNEDDILVVIYSDPIVLARDLVADANGVVTWTGRLPQGLTGEHTLTVQGSVSRGIVLDIPARITTAAVDGCTVDAATIDWGFKESFRSYVSGSIANGEWVVSDGASYETPSFEFTDGDGGYDTADSTGLIGFPGAITFTGHGGILNTTVANPQLRFVDADTAILVLDVTGTTQDGTPIDSSGVEFVTLDLGGATELNDGVLTITDAPAVLTAAGAVAFGTYEEGEEFDPVSASITIADDCALAATSTEGTTASPVSDTSGGIQWWVVAIIALLAAALVVAILLLVRARGRSSAAGAE